MSPGLAKSYKYLKVILNNNVWLHFKMLLLLTSKHNFFFAFHKKISLPSLKKKVSCIVLTRDCFWKWYIKCTEMFEIEFISNDPTHPSPICRHRSSATPSDHWSLHTGSWEPPDVNNREPDIPDDSWTVTWRIRLLNQQKLSISNHDVSDVSETVTFMKLKSCNTGIEKWNKVRLPKVLKYKLNFSNIFIILFKLIYLRSIVKQVIPTYINHSRPLIHSFERREKPDLSLYAERYARKHLVLFL